MADILLNSPHLLALPLELLDYIIDYLPKKRDLKTLRLTNKFLRKLVSPTLFKRFNVYPHVRSLEYLVQAAESPTIGPLIEQLRYDAGFSRVTQMIVRRLKSVYTSTLTEEERKQIMEHAEKMHRQTLFADWGFDEIEVTTYLERAMVNLHNLNSFHVRDACELEQDFTRLPSFYEMLISETCGRSEHTRLERDMRVSGVPRSTYLRAPLMALHKLQNPLKSFHARDISWLHLLCEGDLSRQSRFWEPSFVSLKTLHLHSEEVDLPPDAYALANLQSLLRPAVELERLAITFRAAPDARYSGPDMKDMDTGMMCMSTFARKQTDMVGCAVPVQLTWSSKLRNLSLQGLVCTVKEIKTILKQSAATLKVLRLQDLVLMPNKLPGNRACLVEFLKWMQKHLQLEKITFKGYLTNGGLQYWIAQEQQEGLQKQVRDFVTKGGKNPLEHVAIAPGHFDLHQRTWTNEVPSTLFNDEYAGDESFTMDYEAIEDDSEDDLDEDMSDEDDSEISDDNLYLDGHMSDDSQTDSDEDEEEELYGAGFGHPPHVFPINFDPGAYYSHENYPQAS